MNILDALLNAQGGGAVKQLGQQFGLEGDQATAALSALVPALAAGFANFLCIQQLGWHQKQQKTHPCQYQLLLGCPYAQQSVCWVHFLKE